MSIQRLGHPKQLGYLLSEWVNKLYTYTTLLFKNKKEWTIYTCNMHDSQNNDA